MAPTPHPSCHRALARLIEIKAHISHEVGRHPTFSMLDKTSVFSLAVALQHAEPASLDDRQIEIRRFFLGDSSFGSKNAQAIIEELLAADSHLMACCKAPWGLAKAIELLEPDSLRAMGAMSFDEGGVDIAVASMMAALYECDFRRTFYIRLYNLESDLNHINVPAMEVEIVRLTDQDIPELIGESSFTSVLHIPNTGSLFLRSIDNGSNDDNAAFQLIWDKAQSVIKVLRYLKYETVDVDYGGIYFHPSWVTAIRRLGINILGRPRTDIQNSFYRLNANELPKFDRYCGAYKKLESIIRDQHPASLRLANSLAGNYYEGHFARRSFERDQKLIELVIALETMFSPSREGELSFRLVQRTTLLLGRDLNQRITIMKLMKKVYRARGQLVHSGISPFNPHQHLIKTKKVLVQLQDHDLIVFGDYIRQAILRVLTLVWRGKKERDELNNELDKSALDELLREKILADSDFERAIEDLLPSH